MAGLSVATSAKGRKTGANRVSNGSKAENQQKTDKSRRQNKVGKKRSREHRGGGSER